MARYTAVVESATGLTATAPVSGGATNSLFANLLCATTMSIKLRRITIGVRAGTGAPTSQQMTVGLVRTTARGTQTSNTTFKPLDGGNSATPNSGGVDTAWSAAPTATWTAPSYEIPFNTQATADLPYELLEEFLIAPAASNANGLAFINIGNGLPTAHLYVLTLETEE